MIKLARSLQAWNTDAFNDVLKREICCLKANLLPLQQGLKYSSIAKTESLSATVLKAEDNNGHILVKAGLFYTGIIAGCNCADDPTPVDENNEYCEVLFRINKKLQKQRFHLSINLFVVPTQACVPRKNRGGNRYFLNNDASMRMQSSTVSPTRNFRRSILKSARLMNELAVTTISATL